MSPDDCSAAEEGGAGRVELVSAIEMGGLTPSAGAFLEARRRCSLPIMVMLRPRSGGFCYTDGEFKAMKADARLFASLGAEGFVSGILHEDGRVDAERCCELLACIRRDPDLQTYGPTGLTSEDFQLPAPQWVFHRAFDVTPDTLEALETLISLGFTRLLTSGQKPTAEEGIELIEELIAKADGRIEILPGSGVNAANAAYLLERLGTGQIHATAFGTSPDGSTSGGGVAFNGRTTLESGFRTVSADLVRELSASSMIDARG